MSMCRVFSCVVGRGCLLWPLCSLGKTLLAFALLHFVLQGQTCLLLEVSLDFLLLENSGRWWRTRKPGMLCVHGVTKSWTQLSNWTIASLIGHSRWFIGKNPPANAGDPSSIPGSGRSPGAGNDNPLQYSCQGNPMDRGARQAIVHGVAKVLDIT